MGGIPGNTRLNMLLTTDIRRVEGLSDCRIETAFHTIDTFLAVVHMPDTPRDEAGKLMTRRKLSLLLPLLSKEPMKLIEKETGPAIVGPDLRQSTFVSITYANSSAWVAISEACPVGIDAVFWGDCEGWETVAETYFDQVTVNEISRSALPLKAFALQWASFEARLKCLGRRLCENSKNLPALEVHSVLTNETALAVAFDKQTSNDATRLRQV
jgi:phosphopantetheinyl transferase